jgi:aspartate/methionine/tyrosine aminotransferase
MRLKKDTGSTHMDAHQNRGLTEALSAESLSVPPSGIVDVFTYGFGRQGLIPLWAGEGDLATPSFITEATTKSLAAGETFYTPNRGIPEFRAAVARYMTRLYDQNFDDERFICTIGGMHALLLAMRMTLSQGDEIIIPSPAWPNFVGAAKMVGATPVTVPMSLNATMEGHVFTLDLDQIAKAISPRTKAIVINSPSNPTGWVASLSELEGVLTLARHHGLWIIADEIYGQFVFDGTKRAPSFHDIMDSDDRILFAQTFSKNWSMTGWRIGWLECPPELAQTAQNLIQYTSSGVATFLQRGAVAALDRGDSYVKHQIDRAKEGREIIRSALGQLSRIVFTEPAGAFYFYFKVEGETDSTKLAKYLIDQANVGLAPGSAFASDDDAWLRLCFARKADDLKEAARRIALALS